MKVRLLLILILTHIYAFLAGQDYFFTQYGQSEGLSNSFIYSINQGKDGYLWIGTAQGLYQYDGFEFRHFTEQDSLAENFITTIYKDFSGGLWVGHLKGSITHIDNNRFTKLTDTTLTGSPITSITESDTGTIWFSTQNDGLLLSRPGKPLTRISTPLDKELIFKIRHISGNLFVAGTQENLYLLEYHQDSSYMSEKVRIVDFPTSKVVEIIKIKEGKYFIISKDKGIFSLLIDKTNLECHLTRINPDIKGENDNIQGAALIRMNELWINTAMSGIIRYRTDSESGKLILDGYINSDTGLESNEVKCIFEDREGNIWLGLYGGGLLRMVDDNIKFLSYANITGSDHIYSLSADSSHIWFASDNLIASVIPGSGKIDKVYPFPGHLSDSQINSIYCSGNGLVYLGFEKAGLYSFNPSERKFKKIFLSPDALRNSINHITGNGNTLWISTKKGALKLSIDTGTLKWFSMSNGLPNNNIQDLFIDSTGRVLVGTTCNIILGINTEDSITSLNNTSSFGPNKIMSFAEDNNGSLWIATYGNGVFKFRSDGNLNYTFSSGLLADYCYSIVFDNKHRILVGHRGGFSQIDTKSGKIRNYIFNEGIRSTSDFYPNAVFTDSKNNIWFGTSEGIVELLSQSGNDNRIKPPILHIDAVYVNKVKINIQEIIKLKPGNYEIRIEYTGINLKDPEGVTYQTMLGGYSSGWSDISTRRTIVYENVRHGQYEFKLKAFGEDDVPVPEPLTFKIQVKKPIYLSVWFYIAIVALAGFSLYQFIRIREKTLRAIQEKLLKNLDEKTKEIIVKEEIIKERNKTEKILIAAKERAELSDRLKSSFLANMSHEIRTPMNAIVGLSELLRDKGYSEEQRTEFMDLIVSNSTSLLGLIDDILDISKIESNQLDIYQKECKVYPLINELYLHYSKELKSSEKAELDFRIAMEARYYDLTIITDEKRLKQVLGKLLDNAIKFTDSGSIVLGAYPEADRIIFFVEDTGIGLSEDEKKIIFDLFRKVEDNKLRLYRGTGLGLALSQNLIRLMGGEISVESEVNKGSRFYFSLPLTLKDK